MSLANSSWCLWRFSISNLQLRASATVGGNGTWERPQCLLKASCSEDSEPARVSVPWLWGYWLRRLSIKLGIVTRTLGHQQQMGNADGSCTYQPAAVSGLLQLGKSLQTETPTTCSDHTSDHSSYQQLTECSHVLAAAPLRAGCGSRQRQDFCTWRSVGGCCSRIGCRQCWQPAQLSL